MMLTVGDLLLIIATSAVTTTGVTLLALAMLRWGRTKTIAFQMFVIVSAAILSIVASTAVISLEMYLSFHDLQVLLWVVGASAIMSLAAALVTARAVQRSVRAVGRSVAQVAAGDVVGARAGAARELDDLSIQLAETSQRLADARHQIEQLDASRRQFFAWISHDLRAPLTGMSALAEALEDGEVDNPAGYLRQIRAQIATLNRLVGDLFALSQIQSGSLRLRLEDIVLLDVVSDVVSEVTPLAEARRIRLSHAGIDGHSLRADPHELTRVIVNLLTNSIRHAPADSEIMISAAQHEDRFVLSVLDQGSGVASEDLTRMFEPGWRATTARTPDSGEIGSAGAGLGLAIVQGIVEAHGGEVSAEHAADGFRLNAQFPAIPTAT